MKNDAITTLATYFSFVIRQEIGDDPDHSGPEDAGVLLAEELVEKGYDRLVKGDWRDLLT